MNQAIATIDRDEVGAEMINGVVRELRFVIEVVEPQSLCIIQEVDFLVGSVDDLLAQIGLSDEPDHPCWTIALDSVTLEKVKSYFVIDLTVPQGATVTLRPSHWLDLLPYKTHTGRELTMMLEKAKPLSVFYGAQLQKPDNALFAESEFDTYVGSNLFVKHEYLQVDPLSDVAGVSQSRSVFYALKKEAWRINAYLLLRATGQRVGWCDALERIEGSLLGYSDLEADAYFSLLDKTPGARFWQKHGCVL
jgi:hypothetical protein